MIHDELNISPEDMRKAKRALHIRMRNNALHHFERIDPRTLCVLQGLDLFQAETPPIGCNVDLAVLRDPNHKRRQSLSHGPLVLYITEDDDPKRMIVELPLLLLSDNKDIRQAAFESIERMLVQRNLTVTPKTSAILKKVHEVLMSESQNDWRFAAVSAFDALYDDVLIALNGTRQCLESEPVIQDSLNFYTPKVIYPPVTSLDSISLSIGIPEKDHNYLTKVLSEVVAQSTSMGQLCDSYINELGFLPLSPEFSLAAAVETWQKSNFDVDVWTDVWDWADSAKTPLSHYHACSIFVLHPEMIPNGKLSILWNEILSIVHYMEKEEEDSSVNAPWELRRDLTKHYMYHLEAQLPEGDGAGISCLAWWLAEQVASLLPAGHEAANFYRENWVKPALNLSSHVWLAATSPIQRSFLRHITLNVKSPWAVALLALMAEQFERLAPDEQEKEVQDKFHEALISNAISCLPFKLETPNNPTFAFELTMASMILKWAEYQEDENRKELQKLVETNQKLGTNCHLLDAIQKINEIGQPDQIAVSLTLKSKVYTDSTIAKSIWHIVSDSDWRRKVLSRLDKTVQNLLIESLIALLIDKRNEWYWDLPHYIADLCENEEDEEMKRILFLYVIYASLSSDTVSAIRRLLRGSQKAKFVEHVKENRAYFEAMESHYPPWVAGKLRGLMASIHVV